ncbi:hypothetical protein HDU87_007573 [Geranomyces variabilis]|uniref:TRUD domain-containing protein n=1 Tax=Geranomyces variabilis TaxID=109894 RepID=A0AAD5XMN9_9FUNG|nr:hypothetical protein HDU87_007573 [Geranomyces variabilis]
MSNSTAPYPSDNNAPATPLTQKRPLGIGLKNDPEAEDVKAELYEGSSSNKRARTDDRDDDADKKKTAAMAWATTRKMLVEEDVGITEYIAPDIPGFTGILKTRFTDFQVNEVTLDGQIVHLVSTDVPEPPTAPTAEEPDVKAEANEDVGYEQLSAIINNAEVIDKLRDMVEKIKELQAPKKEITVDEPPPLPPGDISINIPQKDARAQVHACVRQNFGTWLETAAAEGGDLSFKMLCSGNVRRNGGGGGGKNNRRGRGGGGGYKGGAGNWKSRKQVTAEWDAAGGQYTEFTLYKENVDTMTAIAKLAGMMRVPSKKFSYAGSKDKRAATTQKCAISRVPASRLASLNKGLKGMMLGDFAARKEQITLGELGGNHFKIALRDVECREEADIERAMCSLRDNGFVNYFGMQRFGTRSLPTYAVGIAYLNGQFKAAVDMIMEPMEGERKEVTEARRLWLEDKNAKGAFADMPRHCVAERSILGYFKQTDRRSDFLGALESIPRNLRTMYLHSYQSLVWNHMATARLKLYGRTPVIGDLVDITPADRKPLVDDDDADAIVDDMLDIKDETDIKDVQDTNPDAPDAPDAPAAATGPAPPSTRRPELLIKVLSTAAECAQYTIHDVVLPLPGHSVEYPRHGVRDMYKDFMAPHNVDPFDMQRKHKTASLPGSYRKILGRAVDFAWKTMRYEDAEQDLAMTDMDVVRGKQEPVSDPNGKRLALIFELTLKSSQYATMAMREFTKMETAAGHHEAAWNAGGGSSAQKESPVKESIIIE